MGKRHHEQLKVDMMENISINFIIWDFLYVWFSFSHAVRVSRYFIHPPSSQTTPFDWKLSASTILFTLLMGDDRYDDMMERKNNFFFIFSSCRSTSVWAPILLHFPAYFRYYLMKWLLKWRIMTLDLVCVCHSPATHIRLIGNENRRRCCSRES